MSDFCLAWGVPSTWRQHICAVEFSHNSNRVPDTWPLQKVHQAKASMPVCYIVAEKMFDLVKSRGHALELTPSFFIQHQLQKQVRTARDCCQRGTWQVEERHHRRQTEGVPVDPHHDGYKSEATYLVQPVRGQWVQWSLDQKSNAKGAVCLFFFFIEMLDSRGAPVCDSPQYWWQLWWY